MTFLRRIFSFFTLCIFLTSCTHQLDVKNINLYRADFINSQNHSYKIGLQSTTSLPEEARLLDVVANAMKRDGFEVIYPFFPNESNRQKVDFLVKANTTSEYKGSGANFWINWPGFLIWTPAWHGYNYKVKYHITANIVNLKEGKEVANLDIPINLIIRHADTNRTWTEISWLEWSLIAFIGGLCFIKYDDSVTPILLDTHGQKLGDYIASKISGAIIGSEIVDEQTSNGPSDAAITAVTEAVSREPVVDSLPQVAKSPAAA